MKQTLPPPPHARIEDLDEGQLYTLDFCTALLAMVGRAIYHKDQADLLTAGLARIGFPQLSAVQTEHRRSYADGSTIYTTIPTPATAPEERTDGTTDPRPA